MILRHIQIVREENRDSITQDERDDNCKEIIERFEKKNIDGLRGQEVFP